MSALSHHHHSLVAALKAHSRNAGGPLTLTAWLDLCRPTIDPLRKRGVPWAWIAPRLLEVFHDPDGEVSEELEPIPTAKQRSVIELYARRARRTFKDGAAASRSSPEKQQGATSAILGPRVAVSVDPHASAPSPDGTDPPGGRRARIRKSVSVTNGLGQFE